MEDMAIYDPRHIDFRVSRFVALFHYAIFDEADCVLDKSLAAHSRRH